MNDPRKPDENVNDQTRGGEKPPRKNQSEESIEPDHRRDTPDEATNDAIIEDRFEATDN